MPTAVFNVVDGQLGFHDRAGDAAGQRTTALLGRGGWPRSFQACFSDGLGWY